MLFPSCLFITPNGVSSSLSIALSKWSNLTQTPSWRVVYVIFSTLNLKTLGKYVYDCLSIEVEQVCYSIYNPITTPYNVNIG
jgi:hypothetical protein